MLISDFIYYCIYIGGLHGIKSSNLPESISSPLAHKKAKDAFSISIFLYIFGIIIATKAMLFVQNVSIRTPILLVLSLCIFLLPRWYFSKNGEEIIRDYYEARNDKFKLDRILGFIFLQVRLF